MQIEQIKQLIETEIPGAIANVSGDDGVHFEVTVIANAFDGLTRIKRQQLVYSAVDKYIKSGELHALSMKTITPTEHQPTE